MDDSALMSVLDALADFQEEIEAFTKSEFFFFGVLNKGEPVNVFDNKVRTAFRSCSSVENRGNVRMLQACEDLAFCLEASHDAIAIHSGLDQLEGDLPGDGEALMCEIDFGGASFADFVRNFVGADSVKRRRILL